MSTPIAGRTLANVAEISLILVIIHIFKKISLDIYQKDTNINIILDSTLVIIVIAQIFCWLGVITEHFIFNYVEESLWTLTFIIYIVISSINYYNIVESSTKLDHIKLFYTVSIPIFISYVIYMILFDLPLYLKKWSKIDINKDKRVSWAELYKDIQIHLNKDKESLYQKLLKITKCRTDNSWEEWEDEVPWMIGYFIIAGWILIVLILWYIQYKKIK